MTRLARRLTWPRLWLANTSVMGSGWVASRLIWPSKASTSRLACGSRLAVGSSSSSSCGSSAQARASATRCCWPPDSAEARRSASSARPTRSSASSARARAWRQGWPASHRPSATLCRTEQRSRYGRWNNIAWRSGWRQLRLPALGGRRPFSTRSKLVLPLPLAPTRARRSPASRRRLRSRSAQTGPRRSDRPRSCSSGTVLMRPPTARWPARPPSRRSGRASAAARQCRH